MGIDYTLIVGVLLYFLAVKSLTTSLKPLSASLIVVLGYFTLSTTVHGIILSSYNVSLWQLFGLVPLSILALQFIVAMFTFAKLKNSEDSYTSYLLLGAGGCVTVFFIVPYICTTLLGNI